MLLETSDHLARFITINTFRAEPFLLDFSFRPFDVLTKDWYIIT